MSYCIKCGKPLADGAKFCVNCGTPVGGQMPSYQTQQMPQMQQIPQPPKGKLSVGALIGIIAGAVVVSAALGFGAYTLISNRLQDRALEAEEEFDDIDEFDDDDDFDDFAEEEYDDSDNDYGSGFGSFSVPESIDEPEVAEEYDYDDFDYDEYDYDGYDEGYPEEETGYGDPEYVFYDSDSRYLEESEIENTLPRIYIWIAKNEIYARHGRLFKNDILNEYFNSKDWYYGRFDEIYESELNQYEKANIKLLKKYEDKYKEFIEEEKKHYFE